MTRVLTVGAAQLGPIGRAETRDEVVERLLVLLHRAAEAGCELVVYPGAGAHDVLPALVSRRRS